ncbi:MAG: LacI family DNA-binding transcriptional regulator [Rhodothermales bacterium]
MGVTIYDIAEKAKVSIATVSRVFNNHPRVSEKTRERVIAIAEELGYQPHVSAQNLARRKTHILSAVIPVMTNFFFVGVLRGLQDRLAESDFDLLVYASKALEDVDGQLERALQRGRAEGVLLFSMPLTEERVERLKRSRQPIVLVDCFHPEFDSVSINNEQGGYLATRYFIDQGCSRIGMIMANPESIPAAERRTGYERALLEAGLPMDEALVVSSNDAVEHGYTEQAGHDAMKQLLQRQPRPEAVFVASDIQALGALRAVNEEELSVPEDIAIIGFDDIMISEYVGLSTLRQPMYQMGKLAVEKFLMRQQHPEYPTSHTVFSPRLIVRKTSNMPPTQTTAMKSGENGEA